MISLSMIRSGLREVRSILTRLTWQVWHSGFAVWEVFLPGNDSTLLSWFFLSLFALVKAVLFVTSYFSSVPYRFYIEEQAIQEDWNVFNNLFTVKLGFVNLEQPIMREPFLGVSCYWNYNVL